MIGEGQSAVYSTTVLSGLGASWSWETDSGMKYTPREMRRDAKYKPVCNHVMYTFNYGYYKK